MLLYHGSYMVVDAPRLIIPQRLLDFGPGFYLTSDFEQARKWATRTNCLKLASPYELCPNCDVFISFSTGY